MQQSYILFYLTVQHSTYLATLFHVLLGEMHVLQPNLHNVGSGKTSQLRRCWRYILSDGHAVYDSCRTVHALKDSILL